MTEQWETEIYNEIIEAYNHQVGHDIKNDPFVYRQLFKLMQIIKEKVHDVDQLREVVTNAIVLLLTLFFDKDFDDDFDDGKALSAADQKLVKAVLSDAYFQVRSQV
jgi:RNAse (barnase) inhibitor barstar